MITQVHMLKPLIMAIQIIRYTTQYCSSMENKVTSIGTSLVTSVLPIEALSTTSKVLFVASIMIRLALTSLSSSNTCAYETQFSFSLTVVSALLRTPSCIATAGSRSSLPPT